MAETRAGALCYDCGSKKEGTILGIDSSLAHCIDYSPWILINKTDGAPRQSTTFNATVS